MRPDPTPTPPRAERLTAAELDELERLEREATSGPWDVVGNTLYFCAQKHRHREGACWYAFLGGADLAGFIAALRNAAPRLLSSARALADATSILARCHEALGEAPESDDATLPDAIRALRAALVEVDGRAEKAEAERDRLRAEVDRARRDSSSKECPACHDSGTVILSDHGGIPAACDCAANLGDEIRRLRAEVEAMRGLLRESKDVLFWAWMNGCLCDDPAEHERADCRFRQAHALIGDDGKITKALAAAERAAGGGA